MRDRWRLDVPTWDRYRSGLGAPYQRGSWWDPYNQNRLKGDYPVIGKHTFFNLTLRNDLLIEFRRRYVPSNVSSSGPGKQSFFGNSRQDLVDNLTTVSVELFHGDTAFKPRDWAFRFTPEFDLNYLSTHETGLTDIDPRRGESRVNPDSGIQELFGEYKLADLSPNYDFVSVRTGIQQFTSDFRGFLFVDNQPGVRFFGNTKSNRNQFNVSYFHPLEKDTYSRLNRTFQDRGQEIIIANAYRQDLFRPGYTGQLTLAFNYDHGDRHFDNNGVQTRPVLLGDARPHQIEAAYFGWNGDGHFGRWNISHAFYQAFGRDTHNPIARRQTDINAQMAAVEVSYDRDWLRYRGSFFYASGDAHPKDGTSTGFDAIFDNPAFAGSGFSFWQSQGLRLSGTNVDLVDENSLLPTLRSSKLEGQANFVNPGLLLLNVGVDADLTPKWRISGNINWLHFMETRPLELVLNQSKIDGDIGWDFSLGVRHRPFLNENVVLTLGISALAPGAGAQRIFTHQTLFSAFTRLTVTF